jgi:hypothetical protein
LPSLSSREEEKNLMKIATSGGDGKIGPILKPQWGESKPSAEDREASKMTPIFHSKFNDLGFPPLSYNKLPNKFLRLSRSAGKISTNFTPVR